LPVVLVWLPSVRSQTQRSLALLLLAVPVLVLPLSETVPGMRQTSLRCRY
jgi:hypothetical protein